MAKSVRVLLASRSADALAALDAALAGVTSISRSTRLISNGHTDPLAGVTPGPDVLVLRFDAASLGELVTLAESSPETRPPLIVVGPAGNADAVRLAVRSGARDFLPEPLNPAELVAAVERLVSEPRRAGPRPDRAEVTVVLGAAGGVGTSFVACNLAHALASSAPGATLLMDLDVNDAPLASFLDLAPERGIPPAIAEAEFLDEHALQGYVTRHKSGLHLMGAPSKKVIFGKDLDASRFATLLGVVTAHYRHVVVDGSHHLDDLNLTTLGMAKTVVLVVQQSVAQIKQAARLLRVLYAEVGIPDERILVVVNRLLKRSTVEVEDIRRTLARSKLLAIPNQYQAVLSSVDGGIPMLDYDRSSPVTKAIGDLQSEILGTSRVERTSLLRRALPMFAGG